jgi:NADPH:quinone reductase-like Zn-dependent oxidoreductase
MLSTASAIQRRVTPPRTNGLSLRCAIRAEGGASPARAVAVALRPEPAVRRQFLSGYDVVLDSLGGENLEKSLTVIKPGGQAIGVAGPPDPGFAKQLGGAEVHGRRDGAAEARRVRKQARKLGVSYSFLFMQANGAQLRELAALYDAGHLRPVIDKTFPFDQTLEALAYVEQGRAQRQGRHQPRLTTANAARRLSRRT